MCAVMTASTPASIALRNGGRSTAAQDLLILVDSCDAKVRVRAGIAVTREVLGGGQHSVRSRPADVGGHQCSDLLRVGAERSRADDRIRRIGIHVGDGKQVPVHADRTAFLRRNAAEFFRIRRLCRQPQKPWREERRWCQRDAREGLPVQSLRQPEAGSFDSVCKRFSRTTVS